jgi:hypothetical protein
MSNQKVLVIAYYFPPMGLSGVQRTLKFVKYLPEFGWQPTVISTNSGSYYAYDDTLLSELSEDISIVRTEEKQKKNFKYPSTTIQKIGRFVNGLFRQPDSKIGWKKKAIDLASKIIEEDKPDVIFSTAPPFTSHLVAAELSEKYDIPLVLDYRDQWYGNHFNSMPTIFHKHYNKKLEESVLYKSKKIVVISREQKEKLLKTYNLLKHNDISIVSHGYDRKDFENISVNKPVDKFIITHSGLFQDNRNPKPFFIAFKKLVEKHGDKVKLRLVGLMRNNHLRQIKSLKIESNIELIGNVSHNKSVEYLINSDILWILQNDDIRTPGKLYEYFGAKKPILATMPKSYMRDLAVESGIALTADPTDREDIFKALSTYYELWFNNSLPTGNEEFTAQFDRKELTKNLSEILATTTIL